MNPLESSVSIYFHSFSSTDAVHSLSRQPALALLLNGDSNRRSFRLGSSSPPLPWIISTRFLLLRPGLNQHRHNQHHQPSSFTLLMITTSATPESTGIPVVSAAVAATDEELAALKDLEVQKLRSEYRDFSHTQRLGMPPGPRVALTVLAGGTYGLMSGFYGGFKRGSLEFLALNAHRLPRTKGAWYFYHKRKNYVVLKNGFVAGFKGALKYGTATGAYFGMEAWLDSVRGTIDFLSTTTAATVVGAGYALSSKYEVWTF